MTGSTSSSSSSSSFDASSMPTWPGVVVVVAVLVVRTLMWCACFTMPMHTCKLCPCGHDPHGPAPVCRAQKNPPHQPRRQTTESKSAILAHIQLDTPWLRSLRETQHVLNVEGKSLAISAEAYESTLSPASIPTIKTERAGGRHATRELRAERSMQDPPEAITNRDSTLG